MTITAYPHIELDSQGVAIVSGSQTKVIEIVQDYMAHRWDAHEIHRQYPYLGLSAIHSALAYYHDHHKELDAEIESRRQRVNEIKEQYADDAVRQKLKRLGHFP